MLIPCENINSSLTYCGFKGYNFISQLGHPFGQFSVFLDKDFIDSNKSGNLFFKFGNALNIERFFFRSQLLSSCSSVRLLSDNLRCCLRGILTCRLEYAIIHQVENGHFDIECVAQYPQNTRERLRKR